METNTHTTDNKMNYRIKVEGARNDGRDIFCMVEDFWHTVTDDANALESLADLDDADNGETLRVCNLRITRVPA